MIFVHRNTQSVRYTVQPLDGAWVILENDRQTTIACGAEPEAQAVADALNFKRFIAEARTLVIARPAGNPRLN